MPNDTLLLKTTGAVVRKGMSGGPWMPLPISGEANGCQDQGVSETYLLDSDFISDPNYASAKGPRFTEELLISLEIKQNILVILSVVNMLSRLPHAPLLTKMNY